MATLTSRLRLTRVLRVCHQSCRPVPCSQTLPVNTVLAKDASLPHPLVGALSRFCHNLSGQEEQEIYSGILSTQIKLVKSFSLGTSMIGLACQPILYTYSSTGNLAVVLASGAFLSFFTFATPLLIHSISKKYVTKLYYNQVEDKYTAYVYNVFVRPKKIEFRTSDVNVPEIPGMFTTFKARNVPLFVDMSQFYDVSHYGKIMGYDKPLDLHWDKELDMTKSEAIAMKKKQKKLD
ncbi:transmembrane protein 70 homolog, mitochondrial [Eurytemora carolleeae]|uniref:transmembrane protein 70 homolog, mitochondrial n=1 Tax=Eurytemora carolleeae TaxID=1294199 RepID=UPI000C791C96|nr:transmembrane protein 70 homolog, mitochondrial [Eurytemora carolleeae]|eukprot:XP_023327733.1 transmembrane protein 70 homolog, mitochondrial-like [Eurytemora affinis]